MKNKFLNILGCPICLNRLSTVTPFSQTIYDGGLTCLNCHKTFGIKKGIPVFLLKDDQWIRTHLEMEGEQELVNDLPVNEHIKRNRFESWRSWNFLKRMNIPRQPLVLDIGGSSGIGAYLFHRFDAELVIIDIVPNFLKIAEVFLPDNFKLNIVCAGMEWLPFQDNTFDIVFCRQAIHHSYAPIQSIQEMFRVAKLQGQILLVSEPCLSIGSRIKRYFTKKEQSGEPEKVLDKLRDDEFDYIWTDFHRSISTYTHEFTIERTVGAVMLLSTPNGLVYTPYQSRSILGKIMNKVLPYGLGYRGDINIHAVKTRPVQRNLPCPDFSVVSVEELKIDEIPSTQSREYKDIFPKFFDDVDW